MLLPLWLLLPGSCLPGCARKQPAAISEQRFVDAYVQLVQARIDAAGDSVAYAAKRDRVFLDAHLEPADLRAFVESGRKDPIALRDAWQDIAVRLDTLYGGVTSRPPAGLREALRTRGDTTSVSPRVISPGIPARSPRLPAPRPVETRPTPGAPPIAGDTLRRAEPERPDTSRRTPTGVARDTLSSPASGTPHDSG